MGPGRCHLRFWNRKHAPADGQSYILRCIDCCLFLVCGLISPWTTDVDDDAVLDPIGTAVAGHSNRSIQSLPLRSHLLCWWGHGQQQQHRPPLVLMAIRRVLSIWHRWTQRFEHLKLGKQFLSPSSTSFLGSCWDFHCNAVTHFLWTDTLCRNSRASIDLLLNTLSTELFRAGTDLI